MSYFVLTIFKNSEVGLGYMLKYFADSSVPKTLTKDIGSLKSDKSKTTELSKTE
jgi:hypothetical protein